MYCCLRGQPAWTSSQVCTCYCSWSLLASLALALSSHILRVQTKCLHGWCMLALRLGQDMPSRSPAWMTNLSVTCKCEAPLHSHCVHGPSHALHWGLAGDQTMCCVGQERHKHGLSLGGDCTSSGRVTGCQLAGRVHLSLLQQLHLCYSGSEQTSG